MDVAVPHVPNVVGDAPHLRVLAQFVYFFDGGFAWREAENDWTAGFSQRSAQHPDFFPFVGTAGDAIHFDEVNLPACIQTRNGIVIGLSSGFGRLEVVVVGIP